MLTQAGCRITFSVEKLLLLAMALCIAVACAMAITEESVAATERRRDPMEELTRQFKDARALLDDLPGTLAAG